MDVIRIIGPIVALGGFFVCALSMVHCMFRRDVPGPNARLVKFALLALLGAGASAPQPFTVTRSIINGAPSTKPLHWEAFFPKPPFSETELVEARGHSTWQFYHSDRVVINRPDGSRLVDMESQSLVIPVWFVLSLVLYWSAPLWLFRMPFVLKHWSFRASSSLHRGGMRAISCMAIPAVCSCTSALVPSSELRSYDGVYSLSGAGPPDRVPLTGTLTISEGKYVLDTSLGTCEERRLKVPRPWSTGFGGNTVQDVTEFSCGDLLMRVFLSNGQVSGSATGHYSSEKRVRLPPVCVALPSDSAALARGDCARWRTDDDVFGVELSYRIRIDRKVAS